MPVFGRVPYLFVMLGALAPSVWAQTPGLGQEPYRQTVVVTAAATPVELGVATRTVQVVTRQQIDALPVASVADVLRTLSSVDVRARGERGVQTDFAVRGAGFGQVLVLVDGVRLNDAQSGHHNGDIPVPLDAVERIEVLQGPGASIFGPDAFGGAINIVTRRGTAPAATLSAGGNGLFGTRVHWGGGRDVTQTASAAVDRSHGFMYDRDVSMASARYAVEWAGRTRLSLSWLDKEFGANNFYGGNAPSREWTNQTLLSARHLVGRRAGWATSVAASYRTHGDRFVFNQTRPELSDSRHRTHAVIGTVSATRGVFGGGSVTVGGEAAQDWIRSTNLGAHELARVGGFAEWRQPLSTAVQLESSLRADRYDTFGTAWNPSVGAGWWVHGRARVRGSVARGFRVPTFTERYYSDPANLARPEVGPERTWATEGGVDVYLPKDLVVRGGVFRRFDADIIDWLRPSAAVRWQTYNVRSIDTTGVELGISRSFPRGAFLRAELTRLAMQAPAVTQLSKYALDFAPTSLVVAAALPQMGRVRVAPRVEYRERRRPTAQPSGLVTPTSQDYVLWDTRVGVRLSRVAELLLDGSNLFDVAYQEVAGVDMPGAKLIMTLALSPRR